MEGWSRSQTGARNCLPFAKAAERPTREDERSTQKTRGRLSPRNALPNAGVDAGCNTSVEGEVSLDTLLHGRKSYPLFSIQRPIMADMSTQTTPPQWLESAYSTPAGAPGQRVIMMARENPGGGYTRIQGALANLGHRVARTTVANILKEHGLDPGPRRRRGMSWSVLLRAHRDLRRP